MDRIVIERGRMSTADPLPADDGVVLVAMLDLPAGATQNADGTVTLELDYPVALRQRVAGSELVHEEQVTELVLHRLTGIDMRKVLVAKRNMGPVALARSSRLAPARMALISARLDASDLTAANAVVAALGDFLGGDDLPEHAEQQGNLIVLPLQHPMAPDFMSPPIELLFHRLRGEDLVAIQQARETLPAAIARAIKMSPKDADLLFDAMDAADIMAANRVIGFLSGSGRRIGR